MYEWRMLKLPLHIHFVSDSASLLGFCKCALLVSQAHAFNIVPLAERTHIEQNTDG